MARVIYFLSFFVVSVSSHVLQLWEHKNFQGEISYLLAKDHRCIALKPEWQNRVSSLSTNRNCFQLFKDFECLGESAFVYPMSKHHNSLDLIGFNDCVNSIRLCVLDEESLDRSYLLLDPSKPEYQFWDHFFEKLSIPEQKAFRHLAIKHNYSYIPWNFIPGIRGNIPLAQQYQSALDWLMAKINDWDFTISDLNTFRKLSYKVFDMRANRNGAKKPPPVLGSKEDAISFQLEVYWKRVVEAIDDKLDRIADDLEVPKRRPKPRPVGRHLLFWLLG